MSGGKTYSDARVVGNNPSERAGSDERNVFNTNQFIPSQPAYDTKEPPGGAPELESESSTIPLNVLVKTGTQFFSNPE